MPVISKKVSKSLIVDNVETSFSMVFKCINRISDPKKAGLNIKADGQKKRKVKYI